jgi:hypothetical protein
MDNNTATDFDSDDSVALSAFWDAVGRGDPNPPTAGLDPDTVSLVRLVRGASRSEVPGGGRDRALAAAMHELAGHKVRQNGHGRRTDVLTTTTVPLHPDFTPANSRSDPRPGRREALRPMPAAPRRGFGTFASLAAVALLLLALWGGMSATRSRFFGSDDTRMVSIPAVQVSPESTPPADIPFRTIVIPAEYLPAGKIEITTAEYNQAAQTTETFPYLPLVGVHIISTGTFGVTTESPRLVWRVGAAAPLMEKTPGAESIVGPGDIIAYLGNAPQTVRVIGNDPVTALFILFLGPSAATGATEDATVAVRQVTLEPGATLSAAGDAPIARFVESGVLTMDVIPAGESTPTGSVTAPGFIPYDPLPQGSRLILRNADDEPLVFLEAVITLPAEAGTPAAGTPTN